jgi:hypothetical protein
MTALLGIVLLALSIGLLRVTKQRELAGHRFWTVAAHSTWLPILFTAMFGLGFFAMLGGILRLFGT